MSAYKALKQAAWLANQNLYKQGLILYTFGNVSAFDRQQGVLAIKPSGVRYEFLKPEDMVVVDLEGRIVEGALRPSSDTRTHLVLCRRFPGIGGVAHTHSTFATAWAQAQRPVPVFGTTHADLAADDIPCTDIMTDGAIAGDYEQETGLQILSAFRDRSPADIQMVLVAGHGPFTWGSDADEAVRNAVMLEEICRTALLTLQIDPDAQRLKQPLIDKHYQRKHGKNAYYGQQTAPKKGG